MHIAITAESLTKNQKEAILIMVEARTITDGLEKAGVSRSTFYRWMKNPAFRREFSRLVKERYDIACADFLNLGDPAVHALEECLQSQNEDLKFKVAMGVLAHITKMQELQYREKGPDRQERKAEDSALNLSSWACISSIVQRSDLPQPFVYFVVTKLHPRILQQIVSMDLPEEEWQALFDRVGTNDEIAIYSAAFKCLYELVRLSDPETTEIFTKLKRLMDNASENNGAIWALWLRLIVKFTTFKPPELESGLTETATEGPEPPAPQRLKRRFEKRQSLCEPTPSPGV
jgi:hypothetical protein